MGSRLTRLDRLEVVIISIGVAMAWLWCLGASIVVFEVILGDRRPLDVLAAILIEAAIVVFGIVYPRRMTPLTQRITGHVPWFRHPFRRSR